MTNSQLASNKLKIIPAEKIAPSAYGLSSSSARISKQIT